MRLTWSASAAARSNDDAEAEADVEPPRKASAVSIERGTIGPVHRHRDARLQMLFGIKNRARAADHGGGRQLPFFHPLSPAPITLLLFSLY